MFPLGTVLFPHTVLPLRVFEPRYRALAEACLAGTGEFGVVLIERGHEVGGGDTRFPIGTVAQIVRAEHRPDGQYLILAVGTSRLRVVTWLAEEPYPRALVDRLVDRPPAPDEVSAAGRVGEIADQLRRVIVLRHRVGRPQAVPELVFDEAPGRASYQLASAAGLGPLDAQRLLELEGTPERLDRLHDLLTEEATLLELLLG